MWTKYVNDWSGNNAKHQLRAYRWICKVLQITSVFTLEPHNSVWLTTSEFNKPNKSKCSFTLFSHSIDLHFFFVDLFGCSVSVHFIISTPPFFLSLSHTQPSQSTHYRICCQCCFSTIFTRRKQFSLQQSRIHFHISVECVFVSFIAFDPGSIFVSSAPPFSFTLLVSIARISYKYSPSI